jgi:cytochrome P450
MDNLNIFAPGAWKDIYPRYAELRRRGIYKLPDAIIFLASRYKHVQQIMQHPEIFSVKDVATTLMRETPEFIQAHAEGWPQVHTFTAEPEEHDRYRGLVAENFSAQSIDKLAPRIRAVVEELVDSFARDGQVEFIRQFAEPLALRNLGYLVGIEPEEMPQVKFWCDELRERMSGSVNYDREMEMVRGHVAFQRYLFDKLEQRRAAPRQDIISHLLSVHMPDGRQLSTEELMSMTWMLLVAGSGSSIFFFGNAMLLLAQHPEVAEELRSDRALIPNFIEEAMRIESPIQALFRTAKVDTELGGVKIPAGFRVATLYGSANRDEETFPNADRFDVRRANAKEHLALGENIHTCLGAALSRLEGAIAFETLLNRLQDIRVVDYERLPTPIYRGLTAARLQFRPSS